MHNLVDAINRVCKDIDISSLKIFFKLSGDYMYEVVKIRPQRITYEQIHTPTNTRTKNKPVLDKRQGLTMVGWELTPPKLLEKPQLVIRARFK